MERVWISVGSNLDNPVEQVDRAIWNLSKIPLTKLLVYSSAYWNLPLGYQNQPIFLNMVVALDTNLNPNHLLNCIQHIERQHGRVRNFFYNKWSERVLDLDILLFGNYTINTKKLIIPHYDMMNRDFCIYPLIELEYNLIFPNKTKIIDVAKTIYKKTRILE